MPTITLHAQSPEPSPNGARVTGSVSGITGSCPILAFTLAGTAIATPLETTFDRGGCSAVASDVTMKVNNLRLPDGSILAKHLWLNEGAK